PTLDGYSFVRTPHANRHDGQVVGPLSSDVDGLAAARRVDGRGSATRRSRPPAGTDSKLCRRDLGEGRWCLVLLLGTGSSRALVEPSGTADLAPERECLHELSLNLRPRLRAPLLVLDFAQDTVDPKPRVPEALVGVALFVHFVFGPHGVSGSGP